MGYSHHAVRTRPRRVLTTLAGALLLLTTLLVGTAAADHVDCGDTITTDTTLTHDVGPCPGVGLRIEADGVTLDLNGHTVSGDPFERGDPDLAANDAPGILLFRVSGVTVEDGTITGFDAGVAVRGGSGNTLRGLEVRDNINYRVITGYDADPDQGQEGPRPPDCVLGDGVVAFNSSGNRIDGNTVANNGPLSGIALVGDADRNVIAGNDVRDNDVVNRTRDDDPRGTICGTATPQGPMTRGRSVQDVGIRIEGPGAQDNRVERNRVERSALTGIAIHGYVCNSPNPDVPAQENNGQNVIARNTVTETGLTTHEIDRHAHGIAALLQGPADIVCVADSNTIVHNTSTGNLRDGIFMGGRGSHSNEVSHNVVDDNARHGVVLDGPIQTYEFEVISSAFERVQPDPAAYQEGTDYEVAYLSGSGDVTASLEAADGIVIPPGDEADTSNSGCEPEHFDGFTEGDVALVQRGSCTFSQKVDNAVAAGAGAVIIFNEGQPGRTDPFAANLIEPKPVPVLFSSFAVGEDLYGRLQAGQDVVVRVAAETEAEQRTIPGSVSNTLIGNEGHGNGGFDGADLNPDCDDNTWRASRFGEVNQPCVLGPGASGHTPGRSGSPPPGHEGDPPGQQPELSQRD